MKHESKAKHYLWWIDPSTKQRIMAGVAYYNSEQSDFRLKINLFPKVEFYLKMIRSENSQIYYRVEQITRSDGEITGRFGIGNGSTNNGDQSIYMNIGPLKHLVLDLHCEKETHLKAA